MRFQKIAPLIPLLDLNKHFSKPELFAEYNSFQELNVGTFNNIIFELIAFQIVKKVGKNLYSIDKEKFVSRLRTNCPETKTPNYIENQIFEKTLFANKTWWQKNQADLKELLKGLF